MNKEENTEESAGTLSKSEMRSRVAELALPTLLELLMATLFGMVDMIMVGHTPSSAAGITAIGLTNQPMFMGLAAFQALAVGSTAVVAWSIGANRPEDANRSIFVT